MIIDNLSATAFTSIAGPRVKTPAAWMWPTTAVWTVCLVRIGPGDWHRTMHVIVQGLNDHGQPARGSLHFSDYSDPIPDWLTVPDRWIAHAEAFLRLSLEMQ